jgi:hypothetical protein
VRFTNVLHVLCSGSRLCNSHRHKSPCASYEIHRRA